MWVLLVTNNRLLLDQHEVSIIVPHAMRILIFIEEGSALVFTQIVFLFLWQLLTCMCKFNYLGENIQASWMTSLMTIPNLYSLWNFILGYFTMRSGNALWRYTGFLWESQFKSYFNKKDEGNLPVNTLWNTVLERKWEESDLYISSHLPDLQITKCCKTEMQKLFQSPFASWMGKHLTEDPGWQTNKQTKKYKLIKQRNLSH